SFCIILFLCCASSLWSALFPLSTRFIICAVSGHLISFTESSTRTTRCLPCFGFFHLPCAQCGHGHGSRADRFSYLDKHCTCAGKGAPGVSTTEEEALTDATTSRDGDDALRSVAEWLRRLRNLS